MSDTPLTDKHTTDGWSGDAAAVSVEFCRRLERQRNRLRDALKDSSCPKPRGSGIVKDCVKNCWCDCGNAEALKL